MAKRERYTEHPSITVINSTPKLRVFEDFFVEENLPKWRKIKIRIDAEDKASRDGKPYDTMESNSGGWHNGSISDRRSERELISGAKHERRSYVNRAADQRSIERAVANTQQSFRMAQRGDTRNGITANQIMQRLSWWRAACFFNCSRAGDFC